MSPPLSPTLPTLPEEVLTIITHHLDQPSSFSLALVCRRLTECATDRLFRDLNLDCKPRFGPEPAPTWSDVDDRMEVTQLQQSQRETHLAKIKTVTLAGEGRWHKVQTIKAFIRTGSIDETVSILGSAAPNLRSLEVVGSESDLEQWQDSDKSLRWLDETVLSFNRDLVERGSSLQFPALTHVKLGDCAIIYVDFIPFLCNMAPNLLSLDFVIDDIIPPFRGEAGTWDPDFPRTLAKPTQLSRLAIVFSSNHDRKHGYVNAAYDSLATILNLLQNSPGLRQLSLNMGFQSKRGDPRPAGTVGKLQCLQDIHVDMPKLWENMSAPAEGEDERLPSLKRVIQSCEAWQLPSAKADHPIYPSLEVVIFYRAHRSNLRTSKITFFPEPCSVLPLPTSLVRWPQQRPRLHSLLYLSQTTVKDAIDAFAVSEGLRAGNRITGRISSMLHGGLELIHARFLLYYRRDTTRVLCPVDGGMMGDPVWQDTTDYDGVKVPMEILERMKEVENPGGDFDWDRRGVEVGEAAWEVLTDWYDSI